MRSSLKLALVLLAAGLGLVAMGVLLTAGRKAATLYPYSGPNWRGLLGLLLGSLVLWLGCMAISVVLPRKWVAMSGFLTVAGSFVLPWSLHAIGVTWWSYYSSIPALAVLVAGCVQLGVGLVRITTFAASRIASAVSHRPRAQALPRHLRYVLIGPGLGLLVFFGLARWYGPPLAFSFTLPLTAEFDWDLAGGVTAFHLRDCATRDHAWARAREFLIGVQIRPQLDSFLRQGPWRKAAGFAAVDVVKIIPFALPSAWGSDGLTIRGNARSLMRAADAGHEFGHYAFQMGDVYNNPAATEESAGIMWRTDLGAIVNSNPLNYTQYQAAALRGFCSRLHPSTSNPSGGGDDFYPWDPFALLGGGEDEGSGPGPIEGTPPDDEDSGDNGGEVCSTVVGQTTCTPFGPC
jgi:hypothetical protein